MRYLHPGADGRLKKKLRLPSPLALYAHGLFADLTMDEYGTPHPHGVEVVLDREGVTGYARERVVDLFRAISSEMSKMRADRLKRTQENT